MARTKQRPPQVPTFRGVALHHGVLPTAYRKEIERLLRDNVLKVTISSPTLAQGLNLSATAVIMHSLHRFGERIDISEFKNVIGRAGRAYVDVEGIVPYPMFDETAKRRRNWESLINDLGAHNIDAAAAFSPVPLPCDGIWRRAPNKARRRSDGNSTGPIRK